MAAPKGGSVGRPSKLTPEMKQDALDYIENYQDVHEHPIPSVVGMAVVLNVAKSTLYKWAEDESTGFSDTLAKCNDCQELKLINGGLINTFNPTIVKLALANHGYSDKQQTEITGANGGPIETSSVFEFYPVGSDD